MRSEWKVIPPVPDEFRAWLARKGDTLLDLTLAPDGSPFVQWLTERNGGAWVVGVDDASWWSGSRHWTYLLPPWAKQFQEWLLSWYVWLEVTGSLGEAVRARDLLAAWQAREGYTIVSRS
jgi:hypothetical protein